MKSMGDDPARKEAIRDALNKADLWQQLPEDKRSTAAQTAILLADEVRRLRDFLDQSGQKCH